MPQLNLDFLDIPVPPTCLWDHLPLPHQQLLIETLARLMIKAAASTSAPKEDSHD
jgi:hypothetical protein